MTRTASARSGGFADLLLVVALVVGASVALLTPGVPQAIEWVLAVPLLLVLPGYGLVAALFPAAPGTHEPARYRPATPGWTVRLALALAGSVLVLGVVGVALSLLESLRLPSAIIAIDGVVSVGTVAAWYRRRGVAVDARASPFDSAGRARLSGRLGLSTIQTLALAVAVLALVGAVAFVGATPAPADPYSEVSLLDSDGTLLGEDGTATLENGTDTTLVLRLENHEGSEQRYTIVGQLQQVGPDGAVIETWAVDRDAITVADGERADVESGIDPPTTADRLRLQYLVYTGAAPDDPSGVNADLSIRQWIDVDEGAA